MAGPWQTGRVLEVRAEAPRVKTFRLATPESLSALIVAANADARLLEDQDRGLKTERGQAARVALYLFERDAAVSLLRAG